MSYFSSSVNPGSCWGFEYKAFDFLNHKDVSFYYEKSKAFPVQVFYGFDGLFWMGLFLGKLPPAPCFIKYLNEPRYF